MQATASSDPLLLKKHVKAVIAEVYNIAFLQAADMTEASVREAFLDEIHLSTRSLATYVKSPLCDQTVVTAKIHELFRRVGEDYSVFCATNGTSGDDVSWSSDDDET